MGFLTKFNPRSWSKRSFNSSFRWSGSGRVNLQIGSPSHSSYGSPIEPYIEEPLFVEPNTAVEPSTNNESDGPSVTSSTSVGSSVVARDSLSVGPFGGRGGSPFDDGVHKTVNQVIITWDDYGIKSIQTEYDFDRGMSVSCCRGDPVETNKYTVNLVYQAEYLISVSGHYGWLIGYNLVCVRSLTFQSNRRAYGPFGIEKGTYFSLASSGGKIIGFHGNSGIYLDSIGAYYRVLVGPGAAAGPSIKNESDGRNGKNSTSAGPSVVATDTLSVGPFGGSGGSQFDNGIHKTINEITITWDNYGIKSIKIEYDKERGTSVWSSHGVEVENNKYKVTLNYPIEYLISVSGHHGWLTENSFDCVRSLTFQSNRRTYGPFGIEKGTYFSLGSPAAKIIGFHGSSGICLDAIGAYCSAFVWYDATAGPSVTNSTSAPYSVGPFGGPGGSQFDNGIHKTVKQVIITWNNLGIKSMEIEYDNDRGTSVWSRHGVTVETNKYTIKFDYPTEYLVSVSGHYGFLTHTSLFCVRSLAFQSNRRTYGPFGIEKGTYFLLGSPATKIIGFHGSSGIYLDAIGAYCSAFVGHDTTAGPSVTNSISVPFSVGPFGGPGGSQFDNGIHKMVNQVIITWNNLGIKSMEIEYDNDKGTSVWSRHGVAVETNKYTVKFDYPTEYLISVAGHYGFLTPNGLFCVRSLAFQSNIRTYGPFGVEQGTYSSLASPGGKIIGFYGRSGIYIDSIGAHFPPL